MHVYILGQRNLCAGSARRLNSDICLIHIIIVEDKSTMSTKSPSTPVLELRVALTADAFERSARFYAEGLGLEPAQLTLFQTAD